MKKNHHLIVEHTKYKIRNYVQQNGSPAERNLLERAICDTEELFKDNYRYSGTPAVIHSLRVGNLLCHVKACVPTIIAGLLHDVFEDTRMTRQQMRDTYGVWYVDVVEALSKTNCRPETHQKLLIAGQRDIRCLIIKVFDRLDNMRELRYLPLDKRVRISKETRDFYLPLAHRAGISQYLTRELDQLSLAFLQ